MKVVTSFGPKGYDEYAGAMLKAWAEHSKDVSLIVYFHDCEIPEDAPKSPLIEYRNLTGLIERQEFLARFGKFNGQTPQGYNYRMDVTKFCNKVFAIAAAAQDEKELLVWFDADTMLRMDLQETDLKLLIPDDCDIAYLGRSAIDYAETSFLAFNMQSKRTQAFLSDFWGQYMNGEVMGYREWHDGFVFERLLRLHVGHGLKAYNVTPHAEGLDAFHQSPLGIFMRHFKGPVAKSGRVPIKVIPQNCVPDKQIRGQLNTNLTKMDKYISFCKPHSGAALLVSAGPSLNIEEVKKVIAQVF